MKSIFEFLNTSYPDLYAVGVELENGLYTDIEAFKQNILKLADIVTEIICEREGVSFPEGLKRYEKLEFFNDQDKVSKEVIAYLSLLEHCEEGIITFEDTPDLLKQAYELCVFIVTLYVDKTFVPEDYVLPEPKPDNGESDNSGEAGKQAEPIALEDTGLSMSIDVNSVINYALWRNGIHAIREINIINEASEGYENVELSITSEPQVFLPYSAGISYIPGEKTYKINKIPITLNGDYLAGMTEKVKSALKVTLSKNETVLCSETIEITALAFDEWHGYGYYPELLTSFVTPNHPVLIKIISRASEILKAWTSDPSMDAYQTKDSARVLNQAAAIYEAIREEGIVYNVAPASFEEVGQRVRLCDEVLRPSLGAPSSKKRFCESRSVFVYQIQSRKSYACVAASMPISL